MKNLIKTFGIVIIFLLSSFESNYAQLNKSYANEKNFWINLGLGKGSISQNALALSANATYQFGKNVLTLRAAGMFELFGKEIWDYGLLYGITLKQEQVLLSVGVGLAHVEGTISQRSFFSSRPPEKIGPTIGIPLEVQLFWRPSRFLGIGLYGFANLNSEEPFYGFTLNLQIGKLR